MVMVTRSAYRKACESSINSDVSEKNIIPPWCSSRNNYESRKCRKLAPASAKWEIQSTYPLRENIWEYLYEDNGRNFSCTSKRKNRRSCRQTNVKKNSSWKTKAVLLAFAVLGCMVSLWMTNKFPNTDLIPKIVPNYNLISLLSIKEDMSVGIECCQRLKYLTEELARAEQTLRHTLRLRRNVLAWQRMNTGGLLCKTLCPDKYHCSILPQYCNIPTGKAQGITGFKRIHANKDIDTRYIEGATATKGGHTAEWGGRVALWGVVPLWRTTPSPHTVLAQRPPTLADCWPFIGSYGEIIIQLPKTQHVRYVSVEHVKPDTARSAPKHFVLYGVLANNTQTKVLNGQYRTNGPAKQYYPIAKDGPLKSMVFRVLSNHGNEKYTCVYRVHLYGNVEQYNVIDQ